MPPLVIPNPPPRPIGLGPAEAVLERFQKGHGQRIQIVSQRIKRRMRITDLRSPLRFIEVPANPETMRGRHETVHNRAEIDGASFEPMQFSHAKNTRLEFEFILDARFMQSANLTGVEKVSQAMRFLRSLTVPENPDEPVIDTDPVARLEWPQFLEMNVVVHNVDWEIMIWTTTAFPQPRIVRISMEVEETRKTPISARDAMTWGFESVRVGQEAFLPKGIVLGRMAARRRRRRSFGI